MFSSKEDKALRETLRNGSIKDIKNIFGASKEPLSQKEVIQILRLLLGRSNFDFEMVDLLKRRKCDLNTPLGDKKTNPEQYTAIDYLSSYGRLSPRLIHELKKAGYDFTITNKRGEHAGFYLIASAPISDKIIAALKDKGVDFSKPNKDGLTVAQTMVLAMKNHALNRGTSTYTDIAINRLSALFNNHQDYTAIFNADDKKLVEIIDRRLQEIQPESYENIGIEKLRSENEARYTIAKKYIIATHKKEPIYIGKNNQKRLTEPQQHTV